MPGHKVLVVQPVAQPDRKNQAVTSGDLSTVLRPVPPEVKAAAEVLPPPIQDLAPLQGATLHLLTTAATLEAALVVAAEVQAQAEASEVVAEVAAAAVAVAAVADPEEPGKKDYQQIFNQKIL
jgi:hypothetical protein